MQRIDLTGNKFNRWNVIKYEGNQNYLCKCDCGIEKILSGSNVKKGKTKSCGCYRDEKKSLTSNKVELICGYCNQKFNVSPCYSDQKFCSIKCKADSTYQKKKCLICEKEFILSKKSKKLYCSQKCANIPKVEKFKQKAPRKKYTCKNCGINKIVLISTKKKDFKYLFCSSECKVEFRKKNKKTECKSCKVYFLLIRSSMKFCSKKCASDYKIGKKKSDFWYENGYKVLSLGDGIGIKEHIKVMQDAIGRDLHQDEIVHHINENRTDNRLENLQLMTRGEHSKLHRNKEMTSGKKLFKKRQVEEIYPIKITVVK